MPSALVQHPGYLGSTSQGVIHIHADWPAYATEHGVGYALMSLGQFPFGTKFTLLDDIDQCFLFLAGDNRSRKGDAYADSNFHLSLWHEDVSSLVNSTYAVGASHIPYNQWAKRRATELKAFVWKQPDGTLTPVPLPELEEDDDFPQREVVVVDGCLSLTEAGHTALELQLSDEMEHISDRIMQRVRPALSAGLFDSAIREACVLLETELRDTVQSAAFGASLIDDFFRIAMTSGKLIPSQLKTFRIEVRTAFRFVRNEYAHNLRTLEQTQCYAILSRISSVFVGVQEVAAILKSGA
jgi:hypothetical protein